MPGKKYWIRFYDLTKFWSGDWKKVSKLFFNFTYFCESMSFAWTTEFLVSRRSSSRLCFNISKSYNWSLISLDSWNRSVFQQDFFKITKCKKLFRRFLWIKCFVDLYSIESMMLIKCLDFKHHSNQRRKHSSDGVWTLLFKSSPLNPENPSTPPPQNQENFRKLAHYFLKSAKNIILEYCINIIICLSSYICMIIL